MSPRQSSLPHLRGSWGRRWRQAHCHWCPTRWWWRLWSLSDLRHLRLWPRRQNATQLAPRGPRSAGRRSCQWPDQLWIHSLHLGHGESNAGPPGRHPYLGQMPLPTTSKAQSDREGDENVITKFLFFIHSLIIEMLLTWQYIQTGNTSQHLCAAMNSSLGKFGKDPAYSNPTHIPSTSLVLSAPSYSSSTHQQLHPGQAKDVSI